VNPIKNVQIETDRGTISISVELAPDWYEVKISRELVESADLLLLSDVISRAVRAAHVGRELS